MRVEEVGHDSLEIEVQSARGQRPVRIVLMAKDGVIVANEGAELDDVAPLVPGEWVHLDIYVDATAGEYYERANDETLVILQTESPQGVENADEIYALPGCDAIFIGPNDLRFQMREPDGTMPTPEAHEEMVQRVIATLF